MSPSERSSVTGYLVLEDGSIFEGRMPVGGTRFGEVVFNTSMTGYQEVLTDPSYRGQIVLMTQPHIGNYGTYDDAEESTRPWVEGFIARHFTQQRSGCGDQNLLDYLAEKEVPALEGIDTRAVVRRLRAEGSLRGVVSDRDDHDSLLEEVRSSPKMEGRALVDEVTSDESVVLDPIGERRFRVALYDFGAKRNIALCLRRLGAEVEVLPARTSAADCLAREPDAVVLSNGPGDPEPLREIHQEVRSIVDSGKPTLGICLGHQLLGLALGAKTFKLKFGHHGGNQPVRDLVTGAVSITSQNHGFAIDPDSLPSDCRVTAINLNDNTVEGFAAEGRPIFSVQYHPEAAPGPHDAARIFGDFLYSLNLEGADAD